MTVEYVFDFVWILNFFWKITVAWEFYHLAKLIQLFVDISTTWLRPNNHFSKMSTKLWNSPREKVSERFELNFRSKWGDEASKCKSEELKERTMILTSLNWSLTIKNSFQTSPKRFPQILPNCQRSRKRRKIGTKSHWQWIRLWLMLWWTRSPMPSKKSKSLNWKRSPYHHYQISLLFYRSLSKGWHKITLPNASKFDKDLVLKALANGCSQPFTPVCFVKNGANFSFHVESPSAASALKLLDKKVSLTHNFLIKVKVAPSPAPKHELNSEVKEKIKLAMSNRYNVTEKILNLKNGSKVLQSKMSLVQVLP